VIAAVDDHQIATQARGGVDEVADDPRKAGEHDLDRGVGHGSILFMPHGGSNGSNVSDLVRLGPGSLRAGI
jgi:hypothetical protein